MLLEEFLRPLELPQVEAARQLGISVNRPNELVLGKRGVTADTALRLARRFGTTPQFWMHLQADWDLGQALRIEQTQAHRRRPTARDVREPARRYRARASKAKPA